jgi:hypothetical protein
MIEDSLIQTKEFAEAGIQTDSTQFFNSEWFNTIYDWYTLANGTPSPTLANKPIDNQAKLDHLQNCLDEIINNNVTNDLILDPDLTTSNLILNSDLTASNLSNPSTSSISPLVDLTLTRVDVTPIIDETTIVDVTPIVDTVISFIN